MGTSKVGEKQCMERIERASKKDTLVTRVGPGGSNRMLAVKKHRNFFSTYILFSWVKIGCHTEIHLP